MGIKLATKERSNDVLTGDDADHFLAAFPIRQHGKRMDVMLGQQMETLQHGRGGRDGDQLVATRHLAHSKGGAVLQLVAQCDLAKEIRESKKRNSLLIGIDDDERAQAVLDQQSQALFSRCGFMNTQRLATHEQNLFRKKVLDTGVLLNCCARGRREHEDRMKTLNEVFH